MCKRVILLDGDNDWISDFEEFVSREEVNTRIFLYNEEDSDLDIDTNKKNYKFYFGLNIML